MPKKIPEQKIKLKLMMKLMKKYRNNGRGIMFGLTNRTKGTENSIIVLGAKHPNTTFNFINVGYNEEVYIGKEAVFRSANYKNGAVACKPDVKIVLSVHYNGDKSSLYCDGIKLTDFKAENLNNVIELNLGNRVSQGSNHSDFKGWIYDYKKV